nr:RecQ family zinc-binding domain-containing protein [Liquorilactobacillus satsumensis]
MIFKRRRLRKEEKLQALINYLKSTECRRNFLCAYFGEKRVVQHTVTCCQPAGQPPLVLKRFLASKRDQTAASVPHDYREIIAALFKM